MMPISLVARLADCRLIAIAKPKFSTQTLQNFLKSVRSSSCNYFILCMKPSIDHFPANVTYAASCATNDKHAPCTIAYEAATIYALMSGCIAPILAAAFPKMFHVYSALFLSKRPQVVLCSILVSEYCTPLRDSLVNRVRGYNIH